MVAFVPYGREYRQLRRSERTFARFPFAFCRSLAAPLEKICGSVRNNTRNDALKASAVSIRSYQPHTQKHSATGNQGWRYLSRPTILPPTSTATGAHRSHEAADRFVANLLAKAKVKTP